MSCNVFQSIFLICASQHAVPVSIYFVRIAKLSQQYYIIYLFKKIYPWLWMAWFVPLYLLLLSRLACYFVMGIGKALELLKAKVASANWNGGVTPYVVISTLSVIYDLWISQNKTCHLFMEEEKGKCSSNWTHGDLAGAEVIHFASWWWPFIYGYFVSLKEFDKWIITRTIISRLRCSKPLMHLSSYWCSLSCYLGIIKVLLQRIFHVKAVRLMIQRCNKIQGR